MKIELNRRQLPEPAGARRARCAPRRPPREDHQGHRPAPGRGRGAEGRHRQPLRGVAALGPADRGRVTTFPPTFTKAGPSRRLRQQLSVLKLILR
jgi:hypothetical protein